MALVDGQLQRLAAWHLSVPPQQKTVLHTTSHRATATMCSTQHAPPDVSQPEYTSIGRGREVLEGGEHGGGDPSVLDANYPPN